MNTIWYLYFGWCAAVSFFGFAVSRVFGRMLHLRRSIFLIPYVSLASIFICAYVRWSGISIVNLFRQNWYWGVIGGILLSVFTVKKILSQPVSKRSEGLALAFDLICSGILYGLVDALLLSVLPLLATWQAFTLFDWTSNWLGKILVGAMALISSFAVTVEYHRGYPEYRGRDIVGPVIGNAVMSLGFLLTTNPLTAILSHMAMHIAGVFRRPTSVAQLPPHN